MKNSEDYQEKIYSQNEARSMDFELDALHELITEIYNDDRWREKIKGTLGLIEEKERRRNLKDNYGRGLAKAIDQTVLFCENEIHRLKKKKIDPNTPSQIFNDGQIKGIQKVLQRLNKRKENYVSNRN